MNLLKVRELKQHLLMLAGTTTIPDLNHGAFLSTKVPLPPLSEQAEIIDALKRKTSRYKRILGKAEEMIYLLQERRTALISAAVTGKIDVRNWSPTRQPAESELLMAAESHAEAAPAHPCARSTGSSLNGVPS